MAAYSGLSAFADRNHFIAVYPDAVAPPGKRPFWTLNGTDRTKPDDVRFVSDLLRRLQRTLCVDSRRVYATGVSNGGGMAARLGCELSARFAAIAPVAGGYRSLDPCRATRPVSVLEIHGTSDPVVPYDGRPPDYAGSVPRFLAGWTARNGCGTQPQSRFVAPGTQRTDWGGCREQTAVQHLRLSGVGHTWPGSSGSGSAVSASREVWLFFRGRMKSPAR
jgi:polyhydroxybutyrate depolymerase